MLALYRVSSCVRIILDFPGRSGLERSLQTMKGAPGTGWGSRFTCVGGEVYAAVDGIVVLVGRWWLAWILPGRLVIYVSVVYEGDVGCRVLYSKLRMGHEVVDGGSRFGFFQAFVERATERIHHADLWKDRDRNEWVPFHSGKWYMGKIRKTREYHRNRHNPQLQKLGKAFPNSLLYRALRHRCTTFEKSIQTLAQMKG